jgi:dolichol kinase
VDYAHRFVLRQGVHFLCGFGALSLKFFPAWIVAQYIGAICLALMIAHQRTQHWRIHREGERMLSGAVLYGIGLLVVLLLFPAEAAFVGWITLGAGDSASTIAGTVWPIRSIRAGRKSLGGLAGFAIACFFALACALTWWHGSYSASLLARGAIVSVICAFAESFIPRINDNLFLPCLASLLYLSASYLLPL